MKHYTVVIQVKEVHESEPVKDPRGYPVKDMHTPRRVIDRFNLTISAETEVEAYARAIQLLKANEPAGPKS